MGEFHRGFGSRRNIAIGKGRGKNSSRLSFVTFITAPAFIGHLTISGQTLDSNGSALANCYVELELSSSGAQVATTISDGSGNYSFLVGNGATYQATAYKVGSPDVAGITVNTLIGS